MAESCRIQRIGAIQSSYMPWRGYFDFIASVDTFVIYDDVQYSSGSWRNRNQVKTRNGLQWITVPVSYEFGMAIDEVKIGRSRKSWRESHTGLLTESLGRAPYFKDAMRLWNEGSADHDSLSQLNVALLRSLCAYLEIKTPFANARDLSLHGSKTDRLIEMLKKLNATHYLSGPSARDYLDEKMFRDAGISLEYKTYDYDPYPQTWGAFSPFVTVLDLIANVGPQARTMVSSRTPNIAVPCQGESPVS